MSYLHSYTTTTTATATTASRCLQPQRTCVTPHVSPGRCGVFVLQSAVWMSLTHDECLLHSSAVQHPSRLITSHREILYRNWWNPAPRSFGSYYSLFLVLLLDCRLLINSSMILQLWSRYFNVKYKVRVLIRVSVDSVDTARRQVPLPATLRIFNNGGVSLFSSKTPGLMCTIWCVAL